MTPTPSRGYPEPGEMLGPFRIVSRLGFGGMGVVYEAHDGSLQRSVALKVISPHLADDAAFRARFVREAQAQASVCSPHVVAVHSHGEADGRLYIATELVDAGDLGRLVAEHGVPPMATALDILAQVASGLADAHAAGLVHRDIKPANVLLRRREDGVQAYLADFGIARQVGVDPAYTQVGGTVGTPSYMAPELHTGGRAGIESDIYSLGCLLWAALTGTAPYAGGSDYEVVTAHREQPVPQLRGGTPASDAVNQVLLRSLAKRPTERYIGAGAMSRDLREAARLAEAAGEVAAVASGARRPDPTRPVGGASTPSGESIFAPRHTPTPTPAPPRARSLSPATAGYQARRRRVALVVGLVALLIAAGVGVVLALTGGDGSDAAEAPPSSSAATDTQGETEPEADETPAQETTPGEEGATAEPVTPPAGAPTAEQEQRLVDSISTSLVDLGLPIPTEQASCVAAAWVDEVGAEAFADAGFVDAQWQYVDQPMAALSPEMNSAVLTAVGSCVAPTG